ncbi:origin recognition complex subunit 5 isoform X1 [Octopus bimaculoides]|uniref:Origin recognition complex subunit 5 n=2 Tax=Octopus bimaculoides TaxID=37653 RepID=A0A0L8HRG7_OCTBM|nr:origin recognition complex subunit 5 isoform X1 [Octopus bimaculoides]|eukprot:XP_014770006.1 PREDICTED: origin recognition complex subunit 5-like isoform X1 [Octopus bimaculoides]
MVFHFGHQLSNKMPILDSVAKLQNALPCRTKQIQLLVNLFGKKSQISPPALFIYGHTGTGKTLVVRSILDELQCKVLWINCIECYSAKVLYEQILLKINAKEDEDHSSSDNYSKCDNLNDFCRLLPAAVQELGYSEETIYIILDKAEKLRQMEPHILSGLLKLQELTNLNISVILLTEIVWEKFRCNTGTYEPYIIHFPDYSREEILEIMSLDHPKEYPKELYDTYINLVLSVFYYVCRDLKELRHLASINLEKFLEPLKNDDATMNDSRKLWKNIEPHLKKALQTVYLREVSSAQWEKMQQDSNSGQQMALQLHSIQGRNHLELPFYSKYLLIAAYLASYNPAKTDRRFFCKKSNKVHGSLRKKKNERTSNHLLGPKLFTLDRLMAIFYSIVEDRVAPSANLFMQISSLVTLKLLTLVASDDQLETPKYKCLVSLDTIKPIARSVNFDIIRYLYDFL